MDNAIVNQYYEIITNQIAHISFLSALRSIDKLLQAYPKESKAYYYQGVCYYALEKYDESMESYKTSISLDETNPKAHFNLGIVYYIKNDYDNALINIAKALVRFSYQKELDAKTRCIEALNFIDTERKSFK